jgi:PAS domain S-box-containing protein
MAIRAFMKNSPASIAEYFDHSNEYLYSFADKNFRLVKANSLFLKKFQLHSNDYIGKPFQEVIKQIEAKKILQAGTACLQVPGTTIKIKVNTKTPAGEETWFQWEISSLKRDKSEDAGLQIIGVDITEKKKSEQQLLFQAVLLDNISDAVISLDKEVNLKSLNKAAEKIYQVKATEIIGKPVNSIFGNKAATILTQTISKLQQTENWNGEIKFKRPSDKREIHQHSSITIVKDYQDTIIGYIIINRDIKDNRDQAAAISEVDGYYRKMIEQVAEYAIFSIDKNGIILDWNKGAENIKGYKAEEIKGKDFKIFYTKEDRDKNLPEQLLEKAIKDGRVTNEGWRVKKNGDLFWGSVVITALHNDKDDVIGFSKVTRDLSELKIAESLLKNSEKNYRHVLSSISEGFFMLDKNCRVIVANKAAKKMIERVSGRLLEEGSSALDYLPEEKQKTLQSYLDKTFRGIRAEYESFYSLGERSFWLNLVYSPVKDENKLIIGASIIARDITEQKNAERELDKSQRLFKSFMANTPAMGWIIDQEHKFCYLNKAYKTNFQIDDLAIGKSIYEIFPKSICDSFIENNKRAWKTGAVIEVIEEGVGPRGEKQVYQIYKFPLGEENGKKMLGGVALNITGQKMLEQKLANEEKKKKREIIQAIIDAQEKERRELAYELHDNVNQILSSSKLMLDVVADSQHTNIEFVHRSNEYLGAAIKELRRISHNLSPGILKDISLEAAIQDVVEQINNSGKLHIIYRKRNYIKNKAAASGDIQLTVLRIAQEQLNNIIKHAEATEVLIELFITKTRIVLGVKDNGKGFDIENTKRGLGLHNIFNRTEYYQGKVQLTSEPGKGSLLKIEIPLS